MHPVYHILNKKMIFFFLIKCIIYSLKLHTNFADRSIAYRGQLQNFLPFGHVLVLKREIDDKICVKTIQIFSKNSQLRIF